MTTHNKPEKKVHDNLAFSSNDGKKTDPNHITSSFRYPFVTTDKTATLNVECFVPSNENNNKDENSTTTPPMLLFIHGVCESAETYGVQKIAQKALSNQEQQQQHWELRVLELEGHGLSTGQRAVCHDFERMLQHVMEFVRHSTLVVLGDDENDNPKTTVRKFAICGASLGGVLAAYASDAITNNDNNDNGPNLLDGFLGCILINPAVGVNPNAVPPSPVVGALRFISTLAPSAALPFTPFEDPSHYAYPKSSTRNYSGYWPLVTSKMLLDVTSKQVQEDQKKKEEGGKCCRLGLENVPAILIIVGEEDEIVPMSSYVEFYDKIGTSDKELITVSKAGHGLLFEKDSSSFVIDKLFAWLKRRL